MPDFENSGERRNSLLRVAKDLLHERGFEHATLFELAARAHLSIDELHKFFATKEGLAQAVIFEHERAVLGLLDSWDLSYNEPRSRLGCLVRALEAGNDAILFDSAHAHLCKDFALHTHGNVTPDAEERLNTIYVDWTAQQFRASGCARRDAHVLAEQLVAMLYGAMLIAQTLHAGALRLELRRIERWLDETIAKFG